MSPCTNIDRHTHTHFTKSQTIQLWEETRLAVVIFHHTEISDTAAKNCGLAMIKIANAFR